MMPRPQIVRYANITASANHKGGGPRAMLRSANVNAPTVVTQSKTRAAGIEYDGRTVAAQRRVNVADHRTHWTASGAIPSKQGSCGSTVARPSGILPTPK